MKRPLTLGLGLAVLFAAAAGAWLWYAKPATDDALLRPDDTDLVARGAAVYAEACASCHGVELEGQPNWRQRNADGRLPAPPHDPSGHTWHHPDGQLFALTKIGPAAMAGGGYESDMPGFEGTLSDQDIVAALSYIKSRWPAEIRDRHDEINARAGRCDDCREDRSPRAGLCVTAITAGF